MKGNMESAKNVELIKNQSFSNGFSSIEFLSHWYEITSGLLRVTTGIKSYASS